MNEPVYVTARDLSCVLEFGYDSLDDVTDFVSESARMGRVVVLAHGSTAFVVNFGQLREVAVTTESGIFEGVPEDERRPVLSLDLHSLEQSAGPEAN